MINESELNKHEKYNNNIFSLHIKAWGIFLCFYECVNSKIKAFFCDNPELQKDFWVIKKKWEPTNMFHPHIAFDYEECPMHKREGGDER